MNTEWMTRGKCRLSARSIFFPRDGVGVSEAQNICDECPVSQECLEYALENRIRHGVWGGCSERERTRILRDRGSHRGVIAG
jgi:WhiB family transcriptional regulator, redox-sensing transcriptional regulator